MPDRFIRGALGAAVFLFLAGCSEQVTGSLACPDLCTDQSPTLRDTILVGSVVVDSTFTGYPRLGATRDLSLVAQGDTADVRVVARFDSLSPTYAFKSADSTVRLVDSAQLIFKVDTAFTKPSIPVQIDAFDVDTTSLDTARTALLPLFRADRLLGTVIVQPAAVKDTIRVPLSNAAVLDKIVGKQRLRIGLRISGAAPVKLRVAGNSFAPFVRYRVSADSTVAVQTATLHSSTPADEPALSSALLLFPIVNSPLLALPPADRFAVGGLGGARAYLRFEIPPIVLDSVQVIRGTLQLYQIPSRSTSGSRDTIDLLVQPVIASPRVTDIATSLDYLGSPATYSITSLAMIPGDSGQRDVEIVNLIRAWRAVGTKNQVRAVVLRGRQEGSSVGELNFSSTTGPLAQRPRLRLTYVPRRGFGLP